MDIIDRPSNNDIVRGEWFMFLDFDHCDPESVQQVLEKVDECGDECHRIILTVLSRRSQKFKIGELN